LKVVVNRKHVPAGNKCDVTALLQLEAAESRKEGRLPLNLSFVLDRSGSMEGGKLVFTKRAVEFALHHLTGQDYASIVSFDDQVEVPVAQRRAADKGSFAAAVQALYARGSTNLSGGLFAGYRNVRKFAAQGQVNRVLLLTDGLANVGITDSEQLAAKARAMRESGVTLSTLGVGADFDEDLLTSLARAGGGETYFIENPDRIPEIFQRELQGLLSVVAQDIVVAFRPAAGCRIRAILGYNFAGGPDGVVAPVPDMYGGEKRGILLELAVSPLVEGKRALGEFTLEYEEAGQDGGSVEVQSRLSVTATRDERILAAERDHPAVLQAREIHNAAQAMEEAIRLADQGRVDDALFCLNERCEHLNNLPYTAGLELDRVREEMKAQVERLRANGFDKASRKQMVFASCELRQVRRRSGQSAP
jgi:Ca-activated chloride channel family protein